MIKIENISYGYGRRKTVLSDLSLSLASGSVHGLLGSNGVGKTTLIKVMAGLLIPDKGNVRVGDFDPSLRQPSFFRKMFIIPEEFDLPHITFRNFIRYNAGFYPTFSEDMLRWYVDVLNVDTGAYLDGVSMGERKKAYMAFVLACQPSYLFMDEPTNGLDIISKPVFKSLMASFVAPERTVVISTHQTTDIQNLVDNVVIMDKAGIVLNETIERLGSMLKFGAVGNGDAAIWAKDSLSGRVGIAENDGCADNAVDIEMLFHAAVENRGKLIEIVNRQKKG